MKRLLVAVLIGFFAGCGPSYSDALATYNNEVEAMDGLKKQRDELLKLEHDEIDKIDQAIDRVSEINAQMAGLMTSKPEAERQAFEKENGQKFREQLDAAEKAKSAIRNRYSTKVKGIESEISSQEKRIEDAKKLRDSLR